MSNNLKTRNSFRSALPWVGSSIFLILLVVVWPAIELIRISFSKINDAGQIGGYQGLENYKDLLTNGNVAPILIRTFFWVFTVVAVTVLISLPLAQLINQKFPGRKYVRWALIVP